MRMKRNDLISIVAKKDYAFKNNVFKFQKFSINTPLRCDSIFFDNKDNLACNAPQTTIVVLNSANEVCEYVLSSVCVQKIDNPLTDKI